ncbi:MAG TPA: hypothetical protein VF401_02585 [Candidatus Saccharimonadales bacterium]
MSKTTYSVKSDNRVFKHSDLPVQLFQDISKKPAQLEIDAWVASGDIFAMLATSLDAVTGLLTADKKVVHPQLEHQINILLYLQRNYKVVRKQADYRQ